MKEKSLKKRIKDGEIRRQDVARRLAELAFGKPNDCVRLVLGDPEGLERLGGVVVQEECRFNAYADAYYIRVLGTFYGSAVMEGWSAASEFTVELNETVLKNAVSFRAEQAVDEVTGTPLSTAVWTFRLEEKFGWGEGPLPAPADSFSVTVLRSSGMELYEECCWTSVQLEDTATGLRQVRTGVAKSRAFVVVG